MKIKYENTIEDLIAFNEYHYSNSPTCQKEKKYVLIFMPIILFLLLVLLFILKNEIKIIIYGSIFIAALIFFAHKEFTSGLAKKARKLYEERDTTGIICEHILEINSDKIIEKTYVNERINSWLGVQNIVIENDYALIYVGAMQAHVIPRKKVLEGDFDEFLEKSKSYWQIAKSESKPQ